MPEITDQELDTARRLAAMLQAIQSNPKAREHFEDSLKVLSPQVRTQKDVAAEMAAPYVDQINKLQERLDARDEADRVAREAAEERDARQRLEDGFARLRQAGLTEDGEEKVKELMKERVIPDPEAAFALFQRQNPPPPPEAAAWRPDSWNLETDAVADTKLLFTNPDQWEDQVISQTLAEERRGSGD